MLVSMLHLVWNSEILTMIDRSSFMIISQIDQSFTCKLYFLIIPDDIEYQSEFNSIPLILEADENA